MGQDIKHFLFWHMDPDVVIDGFHGRFDDLRLCLDRIFVKHARCSTGSPLFHQELADAVDRHFTSCRIDALFVAAGRFGAQAQTAGRSSDGSTVEYGSFQKDRLGFLRDFGVKAAHDACDAGSCITAVCDDKVSYIQRSLLPIQCLDGLAFFGKAAGQRMAGHLVIVIGMKRLTDFQHDIVRCIDDIIDRTDPIAAQTVFDPFRRTADGHVLKETSAEAFAEGRLCDMDFRTILDGFTGLFDGNLRQVHFSLEDRTDFQRHTDHAEAVSTVCGEFHFINHIIQIKKGMEINADRGIRRKDQDAFFIECREEIIIKSELSQRTHHAIRHDTAKLSRLDLRIAASKPPRSLRIVFSRYMRSIKCDRDDLPDFYIGRACHDLDRCALGAVQLTNDQMISIRMFFNGKNLAGHDTLDAFPRINHMLDRNAVNSQRFRHFFRIKALDIDQSAKPF